MWQLAAAAALPVVAGMLMPKSDRPNTTISGPALPDYSKYNSQMMADAFDPQSQLYALSAAQVAEQVNRQLAQTGLMNSSLGLGAQRSAQADLANQYIQNATQRRIAALNQVQGYDLNRAKLQMEADQYNAGASQWGYGQDMASRQAAISGIAGLANAGVGAYGYSQQQARADAYQAQQNDFMKQYLAIQSRAQQGIPGSKP